MQTHSLTDNSTAVIYFSVFSLPRFSSKRVVFFLNLYGLNVVANLGKLYDPLQSGCGLGKAMQTRDNVEWSAQSIVIKCVNSHDM